MEFLQTLESPEVWEAYYAYCAGREHITKRELSQLRRQIDAKAYQKPLTQWLSQGTFPCAERRIINKMGSEKKRVVYTFADDCNLLLKMIAYHLHRYDDLFAPNLFSFRVNSGVKKAMAYLTRRRDVADRLAYKLDIHDYFNSVDVSQMVPMVRKVLAAEPLLCGLIEAILENPYVIDEGNLREDRKGIMAGIPLSSFLANLYLSDMDRHMYDAGVLYARYSDDIIVFADTQEELAKHRAYIEETLATRGLTVNPKKVFASGAHEAWTFLGVTYCDGVIDVSEASVRKLKGKMRRKARKLYRWKCRNNAGDERAIRAYIRHYNAKFYDNKNENELTWARWFFPVITTADSLSVLDRYMVENIRFIATGKHTKANYRLRYETIKSYGFRSLVHEYYRDRGAEPTVG